MTLEKQPMILKTSNMDRLFQLDKYSLSQALIRIVKKLSPGFSLQYIQLLSENVQLLCSFSPVYPASRNRMIR